MLAAASHNQCIHLHKVIITYHWNFAAANHQREGASRTHSAVREGVPCTHSAAREGGGGGRGSTWLCYKKGGLALVLSCLPPTTKKDNCKYPHPHTIRLLLQQKSHVKGLKYLRCYGVHGAFRANVRMNTTNPTYGIL